MPTHTPGPWIVSGDTYPMSVLAPHRFGADDPEVVCQIGEDIMTPESTEECEANARLIAAAPEMLALAQRLGDKECFGGICGRGTDPLLCMPCEARAILARIENGG